MIDRDGMATAPHEPGGTDLGQGVRAWIVEGNDGRAAGVMHEHPAAGEPGRPYPQGIMPGGRCSGFMPLAGRAIEQNVTWDITAGDPDATEFEGLTLSPSSLCMACGHHGWITDGRWVPA